MQFGPSPATQEYCPNRVKYLQLNGEITLLENPDKKSVNYLALHQQVRRSPSNMIPHRTQRTKMNLIQQQFQVFLMQVRPILLVQDAALVVSL